jgi:hypothetical protein
MMHPIYRAYIDGAPIISPHAGIRINAETVEAGFYTFTVDGNDVYTLFPYDNTGNLATITNEFITSLQLTDSSMTLGGLRVRVNPSTIIVDLRAHHWPIFIPTFQGIRDLFLLGLITASVIYEQDTGASSIIYLKDFEPRGIPNTSAILYIPSSQHVGAYWDHLRYRAWRDGTEMITGGIPVAWIPGTSASDLPGWFSFAVNDGVYSLALAPTSSSLDVITNQRITCVAQAITGDVQVGGQTIRITSATTIIDLRAEAGSLMDPLFILPTLGEGYPPAPGSIVDMVLNQGRNVHISAAFHPSTRIASIIYIISTDMPDAPPTPNALA